MGTGSSIGVWAAVEAIDRQVKAGEFPIDEEMRFFIILETSTEDGAFGLMDAVKRYLDCDTDISLLFEETPAIQRFIRVLFKNIDRRMVQGIAFDLAHDLRRRFSLVSAEPVLEAAFFPLPGKAAPVDPVELAIVKRNCEVTDVPPPAEKRWATLMIKAPAAINLAVANGRPAGGKGARVAQPDTGFCFVAELDIAAIDPGKGWNAIKRSPDATDPLDYKGHPGHGTATGSCVVSRADGDMMGAAPSATLYPIRCIDNVVVLKPDSVARAIAHACDPALEIDVITMSLGGVPSRAVRAALRLAVASGIIVVAAAGNCVGLVVWPARYPECIAVGGCNIRGKPWKGSCRGSAVDITAPAEMVWHGTAKPGLSSDDGQGTSFAVALTAGAAAQWIAYHSREAVEAEAARRGVFVQDLFRTAVQATAQPAPGLDKDEFGPGILDIEALLKLELGAIPKIKHKIRFDLDDVGDDVPADFREIAERFAQGGIETIAGFDWPGFASELGYVALDRAVLGTAMGTSIEATPSTLVSAALEAAVLSTSSSTLKAWTGVGSINGER